MNELNRREIEIIKYLAQGYKAKEIAKLIDLEHRTIEIYISHIRKKLCAKNTPHVIYLASRLEILR